MTLAPRLHFRSIRLTIFLLYAFILLITCTLFSGIIYFYWRHEIYNKVDALLEMRAQGLEDSIRTYLRTRPAPSSGGWMSFFSGAAGKEERHFSTIAGFLTETKLTDPEDQIQIFSDIFDAGGNLIASSFGPPAALAVKPSILRSAQEGKRRYFNYQSAPVAGKLPPPLRAMVTPLIHHGEALYLIQVRASLKPVKAELERIRRMLLVAVLTILLVASWAGILLVKVTLQPVDQMVRKIRNIRSENLSARLSLPNANDEIRRLADTFNEMLERVDKSFTAQKQIVQDLSHELKTPLTIMRGQQEIALKKPRTIEEYELLLGSNLEEIEKMRRIIDDLLMLARLDSRAAAFEMKAVHLDPLIQSALEYANALAAQKEISVDYEGPRDLEIEANDIHLRRILTNLLDNAIKYTPKGGRVKLSLEADKKGVWLKVEDNGIGISREHLPHIFDRFYRADEQRRGDSFGLGLSIVKSIVDAHHGRIHVESDQGKGTRLRIYFQKHPSVPFF